MGESGVVKPQSPDVGAIARTAEKRWLKIQFRGDVFDTVFHWLEITRDSDYPLP